MTESEHLITCLAEECGEVAKECHKTLRFGLHDKVTADPAGPRGTTGPTNQEKIAMEFLDLLGVYQKGVEAGVFLNVAGLDCLQAGVQRLMTNKAERVEAYMEYAERVGALMRAKKTDQ